ncbi:putative phage holin [Aeromicrobium sp. HA]|uniref:putative phage holin n=1 Tax=Aeromicrobium sp. HA TaxID=3009077 RepID=UPI0022AE6CCA|nr:hypothetical protein [Aeromicrobium sp. HA]
MNADQIFAALVYVALPAAVLYPVLYATRVKWWRTWVGQALLIKATGVLLLLTVSALYQFFGPDYFGRDEVRITGMALLAIGLWYALAAMLREFKRRPRETR